MRIFRLLGFGVTACALVACGGLSSAGLTGDGGATTGDTGGGSKGTTPGKDAGKTTTPGSPDAGIDADHEIVPDANTIQPTFDTGTPISMPDASNPTPDTGTTPPPQGIPCGATFCTSADPICCAKGLGGQNPTASCVATAGDCNGGAPIACSSAADCPANDTCCAAYTYNGQTATVTGVSCEAACQGFGNAQVCDPNGGANQCPMGEMCTTVSPGYGACEYAMGGGTPPGH
jgi:hypothetical protein